MSIYSDPRVHVAFARALLERGKKASAFYVLLDAGYHIFSPISFPKMNEVLLRTWKASYAWGFPIERFQTIEKKLREEIQEKRGDPDLLTRLARLYVCWEKWKEAESRFRKALEIDGGNYRLVRALADVLEKQGRAREARKVVDRWCAGHKDFPEELVERARRTTRDPKKKISLLERALKKDPENGRASYYLAQCIWAKDPARAERLYIKAAEKENKDPEVQAVAAGFLLYVRRKPGPSLHYYFRTFFLEPSYKIKGRGLDGILNFVRTFVWIPPGRGRCGDGDITGRIIKSDLSYNPDMEAYERVLHLGMELADAWVEEKIKRGWSLEKMVEKGNASQVAAAVERVFPYVSTPWGKRRKPTPGEIEVLVRLMGHEAPDVRVLAREILMDWKIPLVCEKIRELLKDKDPFKKSAALAPALFFFGKEGILEAEKMLAAKEDLFWVTALHGLDIYAGMEGVDIMKRLKKEDKRPKVLNYLKRFYK